MTNSSHMLMLAGRLQFHQVWGPDQKVRGYHSHIVHEQLSSYYLMNTSYRKLCGSPLRMWGSSVQHLVWLWVPNPFMIAISQQQSVVSLFKPTIFRMVGGTPIFQQRILLASTDTLRHRMATSIAWSLFATGIGSG